MASSTGIKSQYIFGGLAIIAIMAFKDKLANPLTLNPNAAKRYINRLMMNIVAFKINVLRKQLFLRIKISNPNANPISIQSMVGNVYYNGSHFGNIAYYSQGPILPLQDSFIDLEIRMINNNYINYFMGFYNGSLKGSRIDFVGNVSVNNQILAVKESFVI